MICSKCDARDQMGSFCEMCGEKIQVESNPPVDGNHLELAMQVFAEKVSEIADQPEGNSVSGPKTQKFEPEVSASIVTPQSPTSAVAIAALISVFFIPLLGLILGYLAKKEISNSQGLKSGAGLAKASIVLGWIFVSIGTLFTLLVVAAALS